jgi:hypothetical protein
MPIRRPRGPKPALKHVAFLEAMDRLPETDSGRKPLEAAFLTLRVLDSWMWLGVEVASPTSQVLTSAKTAVQAATKEDSEAAAALSGILESVVLLQEPDAQPVLPRVFALGGLYEQRGAVSLAGDVYSTVVKYVDSRAHFDLAYDAAMRQAFCLRVDGILEHAQRSYESAGALAARARDRSRVLLARIGEAKVTWAKGNLPASDSELGVIAAEAEKLGDSKLHGLALHDQACVARLRDDLPRATRLAFEGMKRMQDEIARERVLIDLANFLALSGSFDTARTALSVIERGAKLQESKINARINLMDLGTRQGSETLFEQYRRLLESDTMHQKQHAVFLRDAGKGFATFGRATEARTSLGKARELAAKLGLNQIVFEVDELSANLERTQREAAASRPSPSDAPADIRTAIDELLKAQLVSA